MMRKNIAKENKGKNIFKKAAAALLCAVMAAGILFISPANVKACDGCTYNGPYDYIVYYASVDSGYLALRTAKAFDSSNEIGRIYNNEPVYVVDMPRETYWYVYVPSLNMWGYTNSCYLVKGVSQCDMYTVHVESGYLALRNGQAFDSSNEIGRLYTGEKVEVLERSEGTYWYVYAPTLGKQGYVNRNYLTLGGNSDRTVYTAKVQSGYLALRTAKAFDSSNEIGRIYTGEKVEVITKESGDYWWVYVPCLGKCGYTNKNYLF